MTASSQLRAVIYDRESKGNPASIASQNTSNLDIVDSNGYRLVGQFSDRVGASRQSTKVRKGWPELRAVLDAHGADVVVTTEPSRLDRNLERWVPFVNRCREAGIMIHLSGDDDLKDPRKPGHWKSLIDAGVAAQMETDVMSKRVTRGTKDAAIAGGFHGLAAYGYERVMVGYRTVRSGDRMVKKPAYEQRVHPEHGPIVKSILERLAARVSINAIVNDLNAKGIPAPEGGIWRRNSVRNMAFRIAYVGKRQHGEKVYDGTWEPLVNDKTFYDAQAVLSDPKRVHTRPGRLKHLLSYLATAPCGEHLQYRPERGVRTARYACKFDGCTSIPADLADEYVTRVVVERVSQPDARSSLVPTVDGSAHQAAEQEKAALVRKLKAARASFAKPVGGISIETLEATEQALLPLIADAEKRAIPPATSGPLLELLDAAEVGREQVRPTWDTLTMPARREVLVTLFGSIRVEMASRRLTRFTSDDDRAALVAERITLGAENDAEALRVAQESTAA